MKSFTIFLVLVAGYFVAANKSYAGYKTYKLNFDGPEHAKLLQEMEKVDLIEVWKLRKSGVADIMVSPEKNFVLEVLRAEGLEVNEWFDVEDAIKEEQVQNSKYRQSDDWWTAYHPLDEIDQLLRDMANATTDASIEIIGTSSLGRSMPMLKVCRGGCGNKPAMLIQGGIHAREWIAPAVVTWMINELLTNQSNSYLINGLDWYFVPNVNPDGYEYTWSSDRMWRKTRSIPCVTAVGVDANRNYDFCWNTGGSSDACLSDTYHGPSAFSEPEIKNIVDFAAKNVDDSTGNGIKFFNDVHSYSEFILLPYGLEHNVGDPAGCDSASTPNAAERFDMACNRWNLALEAVHGLKYLCGNVVDLLYEASGGSFDYMLGVLNIKYSIGMELRPANAAGGGFLLPPAQIIPTAEEVWGFHKAAAADIMAEFGRK